MGRNVQHRSALESLYTPTGVQVGKDFLTQSKMHFALSGVRPMSGWLQTSRFNTKYPFRWMTKHTVHALG